MDLANLRENGVFFHTTSDHFCPNAINLASSFQQLGIPVSAQIEFSEPNVSEFRFAANSDVKSPAMIVVDLRDGSFQSDYPYNINSAHTNTVILAICDNVDHLNYAGDLPVFRGHTNRFIGTQYRYFPSVFGISDKLLNFSQNFEYSQTRLNVAIKNFRASRNQNLRSALDLAFVPILEKKIAIDRSITAATERWENGHLGKLGKSLMCLAYGGNFTDDLRGFYARYTDPADPRYSFLTTKSVVQPPVVTRWDSWRFWESLAMGCVTIHLDFDKYGFELPVMPVNGEHYIGLSFDRLSEDVTAIFEDEERLVEIGKNGRAWALEHYSPIAIGKRFLKDCGVNLNSD